MLLLSMATPSIHVAHPHVLISTYHLSADQTFLLELPVCICVVARYVIVSPSSILASRAKWEKSSRLQHAAISGKLVASALYLVRLIVLLGQNEQCWAAQPTAIHSTLVAGDLPSPIQSDCTYSLIVLDEIEQLDRMSQEILCMSYVVRFTTSSGKMTQSWWKVLSALLKLTFEQIRVVFCNLPFLLTHTHSVMTLDEMDQLKQETLYTL